MNKDAVVDSDLDFRGYRIANVFRAKTEEEIEQIADLWRRNRVLPRGESPYDRVPQVVYAAYDAENRVVAASTVYRDMLAQRDGAPYFFYRMFIEPAARVPWLMRHMTMMTYEYLRDALPRLELEDAPKGLVIIMENPKLSGPGMRRRWERWGCTYLGPDPRGHDIWFRDF